MLQQRYPEYARNIDKYFSSVHFQAERMMSAMLPDSEGRLDLVFDFSSMGPYHNGTFEAAKHILRSADQWLKYFHIYVMVSDEAQRFHKLDELKHIFLVPVETTRTFALAFRLGQPFDYEKVARMSQIAVMNVYMMLDTIAMDCLYLDHGNLEILWGTVFGYADAVLYISDFVQEQFRRRFRLRPGLKEMAAYLSLDVRDYRDPKEGAASPGSYILVIGNSFAHKHVVPTVEALTKAFPREKIVALGLNEDSHRNVIAYPSGHLTEEQVRELLRGAKFVVFPSHYEGFGIPVVESLAYSKPVMARSIPVMQDLNERLHAGENLILYNSTKELISRLKEGFPKWQRSALDTGGGGEISWDSGTAEIGEFLHSLVDTWSFTDHLVPRLEYMRILEDHKYQLQGAIPAAGGADNGSDAKKSKNIEARVIRDLNAAIRERETVIRDREMRIKDIENSWSWRITAPVRKIAGIFMKG